MKRKTILAMVLIVLCLLAIGSSAQQQGGTGTAITNQKTPQVGVEYHPLGTKGGPMMFVPAGEFMMGSTDMSDQVPIHSVYLDAFYIDKYEVTNGKYAECVKAGKCEPAHFDDGTCDVGAVKGKLPKSFRGGNQPVVCIDWSQSKTYCEWVGKRLPTEAEWEKAARGTDGRTYPWGNQEPNCSYATNMCSKHSTSPVGSKPKGASPYGAMDMAGNVLEWTADWYDENYYSNSPSRNPTGPPSGEYHVLRGGAYINDGAYFLRSSYRLFVFGFGSDSSVNYFGMRCAKSP